MELRNFKICECDLGYSSKHHATLVDRRTSDLHADHDILHLVSIPQAWSLNPSAFCMFGASANFVDSNSPRSGSRVRCAALRARIKRLQARKTYCG